MKISKKSVFGLGGFLAFAAVAGFIYHASVFRPLRNFHVVDEGKFYRSAQLTGQELRDLVSQYGIKTVINLRGTHPDQSWYAEEHETLQAIGVRMESVAFSTDTVPPKSELAAYLDALQNSPRPILVHCRAGADRTGEATAIYAMEYMGKSRAEALEYLTFKYLHVPLFQPAKRYLIEHYQGRDWAKTKYEPCSSDFLRYSSRWDCPADKYPERNRGEIVVAGWTGSLWNFMRDVQ